MTQGRPRAIDQLRAWLLSRPGWQAVALALLASIAAMSVFMLAIQPWPCEGTGDCMRYRRMSEAFQSGTLTPVNHPFHARLLSPWIASWLADDAMTGFTRLTIGACLAFAVSWCLLARQLGFNVLGYGFLIAWFLLHPLGWRTYFSLRMMVDPLAYALMPLAIWCFVARRDAAFFLCIFVALFSKESFLMVLLAAVLAELHAWHKGRAAIGRLVRFGAVAALVFMAYRGVLHLSQAHLLPQEGSASMASNISDMARIVLGHPAMLVVWLGALFCVVGVLPGLLPFPARQAMAASRDSVFLALGAAGFVAAGLLGGVDLSRIIAGGFPVICAAILHLAGGLARTPLACLAMCATLAISVGYSAFFPGNFEYGYYVGGQGIGPSLAFVLVMLALNGGLWLWRARRAHAGAGPLAA